MCDENWPSQVAGVIMGRAAALVWCPYCEDWTNADSINASTYGETNDRHIEEEGLRFHQRFRQCPECDETFYTAELSYPELRGLMSDRGKLAEANAKLDAVRKALRTKR